MTTMDNPSESTLLVKCLPKELTPADHEDLLKHFGAVHVRCMGTKGRMKNTAFASFEDQDAALQALKRLHQLQVLNSRLVVEFSKAKHAKHHPAVSDNWPEGQLQAQDSEKEKEKLEKERAVAKQAEQAKREKLARTLNTLCSNWGCEYPFNPKLRYMYPPPTASTVTNIANTLASVPKFYVQVLHLMNKMNLPAPFGPVTACPPLAEENAPPPLPVMEEAPPPLPQEPYPPEQMEQSSSEESELESDSEGKTDTREAAPAKRPGPRQPKPIKRARYTLKDMIAPSQDRKAPGVGAKPSEVFEQPPSSSVRTFNFKLPPAIANTLGEEASEGRDEDNPPIIAGELLQEKVSEADSFNPPITELPVVEEGGFGKIEPSTKDVIEEDEEQDEEWGASEFISSRRLRKGRISRSEMKEISVFKKYEAGEPTSRLYIKNLAKQVTEKDLHYMFGRYVNWDNEQEKLMFDIRLMKEGRMKGQAFITLPKESRSKEALEDTHGFLLHGKPMVVQFARSAKPKEKPDDQEQKKDKK